MKGINNYIPKVGEKVLLSPPNSDNLEGYVYQKYITLWINDFFILYGNEGMCPNLDRLEHVKIKKCAGKPVIKCVNMAE